MPYIKQEQRRLLDPAIDNLVSEIQHQSNGTDIAGVLNYCITSLILRVIPDVRYGVIASVTGVLENVKQEFYRRLAAIYEDKKIVENGDVYNS